jgi:hypothetical protein
MEASTIYHLTRSSDNALYFLQVVAAMWFVRNIQPAKCAVVAGRPPDDRAVVQATLDRMIAEGVVAI